MDQPITIPANPCKCGDAICEARYRIDAVLGLSRDAVITQHEAFTAMAALHHVLASLLGQFPPRTTKEFTITLTAEAVRMRNAHAARAASGGIGGPREHKH